jgi:hypothetical protein
MEIAIALTWLLLSTLAVGLNYCMAKVSAGEHTPRPYRRAR